MGSVRIELSQRPPTVEVSTAMLTSVVPPLQRAVQWLTLLKDDLGSYVSVIANPMFDASVRLPVADEQKAPRLTLRVYHVGTRTGPTWGVSMIGSWTRS